MIKIELNEDDAKSFIFFQKNYLIFKDIFSEMGSLRENSKSSEVTIHLSNDGRIYDYSVKKFYKNKGAAI